MLEGIGYEQGIEAIVAFGEEPERLEEALRVAGLEAHRDDILRAHRRNLANWWIDPPPRSCRRWLGRFRPSYVTISTGASTHVSIARGWSSRTIRTSGRSCHPRSDCWAWAPGQSRLPAHTISLARKPPLSRTRDSEAWTSLIASSRLDQDHRQLGL
jgi:hypothetical protein